MSPDSPASMDPVLGRMQADWNRRALEDPHYYVAFGRRQQDDEEFFATASEQVRGLELELIRLSPSRPRARRALEIGCGPGRLMRGLARHFGEIHGVDISEEMIRLARAKLAAIPHAHPHHAPNSDLAAFADDSFDFVYSYAVFQHIPAREVVIHYLHEAARVLRPGGILRCQLNGLPPEKAAYDTWSGVRIAAAEVREFASTQNLLLLALEGAGTQYMWVTLRKPPSTLPAPGFPPRLRRITNAWSSEPVAPVSGRFAALSLWVEGLPPDADLNSVDVEVGGAGATTTFLGHPEPGSLQQLNVCLPTGLESGLAPVTLRAGLESRCFSWVRLIRPGPPVPRILSVTDGIDLLSGPTIVTGSVKVVAEEILHPEDFRVSANGVPVDNIESFCTDPRLPRVEFNFRFPDCCVPGAVSLEFHLGAKHLGRFDVTAALSCLPATEQFEAGC